MPATKERKNRTPSNKVQLVSVAGAEDLGVFESRDADAKRIETTEQLDAWLEANPGKGGLDIRGRVLAQVGPFKSKGRGQFDQLSIEKVVSLANTMSQGLKSNYRHPSLSNDGLGSFLGRDYVFYLDKSGEKLKARSRHFVLDETAMLSPPGGGGTPYGVYVAKLAISDPAAFSSSLQLGYKPAKPKDNKQPVIWRPTKLLAIDVVAVGDAVDDFLGFEGLSENQETVVKAHKLITNFFDMDQITPEALTARLNAFTTKVVQYHFEDTMSETNDTNETQQASPEMKALLESSQQTNKLLGDLASSMKPQETPPATEPAAHDPKKIAALCNHQQRPEMIAKFLADETPTEQVKDALLALDPEGRQLDDNENDNQHSSDNEDSGDLTVEQTLLKEYNEDPENAVLGLSFEDFKTDRLIEMGQLAETAEVMKSSKSIVASGIALMLVLGFAAMAAPEYAGILISLGLVGLGMAVTVPQLGTRPSHPVTVRRKVAASINIIDGTLVFILPAGHATDVTNSGANVFGGLAQNGADNSAGAAGDLNVETIVRGLVGLKHASHSLTIADVESNIYASDNYTITTTSTNNSLIGVLKDITDDGEPLILFG